MSDELREALELKRRERLHRQIGALERQLEYMGRPITMWERIRVAKVKNRIVKLKADLNQPMLIDLSRPRGVATGT
ncbi:MAG TPA: hypothetical protein VM782_05295 [Stellaceae bacterium]|nr:hypothetical protein [Stellaceae bacterium]